MTLDITRSVQTSTLIEYLRLTPLGGTVTYDDLSEAIGEDVRQVRHHLYTALKALHAEGIPYGTVRSMGIKRLVSDEIPAIGETAIHRIRRASRLARKRMSVVGLMNDVSNEVRVKVSTAASLLGVIENFAGNRVRKVAETEVEKQGGPLPPMKLLAALRDRGGER